MVECKECKAVGIVTGDINKLHNLLRGLSSHYDSVNVREVVMKTTQPTKDGSQPSVRLTKIEGSSGNGGLLDVTVPLPSELDQQAMCKWTMRYEGGHLFRKKELKEMDITVRDIIETVCCGDMVSSKDGKEDGVLDFWKHAGFAQDHEVTKKGNQYWCKTPDKRYTLLVRLIHVYAPDASDSKTERRLFKEPMLELMGRNAAKEDDFLDLAKGMLELGKTLAPFVTLRRAHNLFA